MNAHLRASDIKTFVVCIFAALLAVALAAIAHADPTDDNFLGDLARDGITGDPAQLIAEAHTVCDIASSSHNWLDATQQTFAEVQNTLHLANLPTDDFLDFSGHYYCPKYIGLGDHFAPGL